MGQKVTGKTKLTRKTVIGWAAGIGLVSGVMGFLGIPGLFPAIFYATKIDITEISFCDPISNQACKDLLIGKTPEKSIIIANRLTFSDNVTLNKNSVILANEIDLGGNTVIGMDRLVLFTREARNGQFRVIRYADQVKGRAQIDGADGAPAGELIGIIGQFASSLRIEMAGLPGGNGLSGNNGPNGRNGRCDAFKYKGNRPGGNGQAGGNAGNGGNGGSIDIWYGLGPVSSSQVPVDGGQAGSPGVGGQGGKGGDGCVGPGGSQDRDSDGFNGPDGNSGIAGRAGKNNLVQIEMRELNEFAKILRQTSPNSFEGFRSSFQNLSEQ